MPRQARVKEKFSIYHIITRGNEKKQLFLSDNDRRRYMQILKKVHKKYKYLLIAFCLMDNHVHLLISDNGSDISKVVASINIIYAQYFNRKYERCGHLFQDRYRSELVNNDRYFLAVSRYIHNNPVKAGIVSKPCEWPWSSCKHYCGEDEIYSGLIEMSQLLRLFSDNRIDAIKQYKEYVYSKETGNTIFMDVDVASSKEILSDECLSDYEQAQKNVQEFIASKQKEGVVTIGDIKIRNELIRHLRETTPLTLKQIGQLIGGISESMVSKIIGKNY